MDFPVLAPTPKGGTLRYFGPKAGFALGFHEISWLFLFWAATPKGGTLKYFGPDPGFALKFNGIL